MFLLILSCCLFNIVKFIIIFLKEHLYKFLLSNSNNWLINDCLWIGLNCSNYDISFDIIWLLTVIWLFFTWYQLLKPENKLRLNYSFLSKNIIYQVILISLLFSLVPIVLKFIPLWTLPVIWYDVFREILSLIVILILWIIIFKIIITPITKINPKKILGLLIANLWQWDRAISAIWFEFSYFFEDLVKNVDNKDKDAFTSLLLCENNDLIKYIAEDINAFNTLLRVYDNKYKNKKTFSSINDESYLMWLSIDWAFFKVPEITDSEVKHLHVEFLNLVIDEALNNENSILSKELNWKIYKWINKWYWLVSQHIFNDFGFIHEYNLLEDRWWPYKKNSDVFNNNYIKFRESSIDSFFDNEEQKFENNINYHKDLYSWICKFCWPRWILNKSCEKLENLFNPVQHFDIKINSLQWLILSKCLPNNSNYYKITWQWMFHPVIEEPKDFIESISWWCFKLLESLSYIKETSENERAIRHLSCEIYMNTFTDDVIIKRIQENLKNLMKWHIEKTNWRWFYPNMTRIFFHIFWRYIFFDTINDEDRDFVISVMKIISKALKNFSEWRFWYYNWNNISIMDDDLIENRDKKIKEIMDNYLPKNMVYNKENHTLTFYSWERLEKKTINLDVLDLSGEIEFCD